ncbi:GNAT family N-acetyltransferase [Blastochloris tepida]|uniref:N-acetyltransferase GCN5 n=1 Tax=Blastochloris tepida TaxID=2233851 RepID=A0A348G4G3_9HYPH|nr:GNAT family N-acetyltransferase [Blastochloris tepida]BBF94446.1 N-acetyltransferase GCN5 [Blastochloris tepida]
MSPGSVHIEKLGPGHDTARFDCGHPALNRFLQAFALQNQKSGSSQTYVAVIDDAVAGYHCLTVGDVSLEEAPERMARGMPRHPVPVMIVARLAVDRAYQGRKLGGALLKDALRRTLAAADIAGIRAVIVHAKDDKARAFYERFGFARFPAQPLTLFLLLKDLRASAGLQI